MSHRDDDFARILGKIDAWEGAARDYGVVRGPINERTAIQDTFRRQQLAEQPFTTESALATDALLFGGGEAISRAATRLGIDATPLDAFLLRPDADDGLRAARVVVKRVRQTIEQREQGLANAAIEPPRATAVDDEPRTPADAPSRCAANAHTAPMLLTTREAAQALGVCPKTVYNLTKSGSLRAVRLGNSVRYDAADVRRLVESAKGKTGETSAIA